MTGGQHWGYGKQERAMDGFGDIILEVGLPRLADGLTMAIQNKFYKLLHVAYLYKETTGGKNLG